MGDWVFPDGVQLEDSNTSTSDVYQNRVEMGIELLRRNGTTLPEGLYRCEIPSAVGRDVIYVGLYLEGNGEKECLEGRRI